MAHMTCKCNVSLSNTLVPNLLEGEIKGIYEYENKNVWECRNCGRLCIDIPDPNCENCHISKSYVPEDGQIGELFNIGTGEQLIKHLKYLWAFHKKEFLLIEADQL